MPKPLLLPGRLTGIFLALLISLVSTYTGAIPPPANIRVTTIGQLNNEEQVFISPVDSNIIISVWRDFRLGYRQIGIGRSTDAGQTWIDSLINPFMQYFNIVTGSGNFAWQSDPTLTVDASGNFVMSVLDFSPTTPNFDSSVIAFYRSTDGGVSWTGPVPNVTFGNFFEDKQFITIDRTGGPHDGNVYVTWARFGNPDRMMFQRSIDDAASFEDTIIVGPTQTSTGCGASVFDAGQFPLLAVNSNGDVHVFWYGVSLDSGGVCTGKGYIKHSISTDGGQTFTYEDLVQQVSAYTSAAGAINTYSMPIVDADITGGPFDGRMYLVFTNRGPEDVGRTDVDFMVSDDNASTWTPRQQVNDYANSGSSDAFHPWLVVNEDGIVAMVFYDNRVDEPSHFLFDLFAAYSYDGGETITANHRISTASSNPNFLAPANPARIAPVEYVDGFEDSSFARLSSPQAGKIGEYIGLSAHHDKLNATWTDSRDLNSEVYTANWYLPLLEARLLQPTNGSYSNGSAHLYWATSWKNDEDSYRYEISGDSLFTSIAQSGTTDTNFVDVSGLSDGVHYWRIKSFNSITGDSAEYSSVRNFVVDLTPPSVVTLLAPDSGKVINNAAPTLDWTDAVDALSSVAYDLEISTDQGFPVGPMTQVYADLINSVFTPAPLSEAEYFWRVKAHDEALNESVSEIYSFEYIDYICGDADGSGMVNIADVTFLIARIFSGGPAPAPPEAGDADGSGAVNIADVTYLIARIFSGGPPPVCP